MGGSNPYIEESETPLPSRSYQITFQPEGKVVTVDPAALPYSREGKPGSILEIAIGNDIEIDPADGRDKRPHLDVVEGDYLFEIRLNLYNIDQY